MQHRSRVLIVEDNLDDERLTIRALKRSGIDAELIVVRNGQDACEYLLDDRHELPELVLLDLKLPKLNGHEVLLRLRQTERTRQLPVVVFSSSTEKIDIAQSYDCGANSYVPKPVSFEEFMSVGQWLGSYWLRLNRCPFH